MTAEKCWYVVHTQPQHEVRAQINLERQGFVTYLPRYLKSRRHARKTDFVPRALFPRYFFVALDLARDRWRAIQSTYGVNQVVVVGERPVPLPDGILEDIRAREADDGYVTLGLPSGVKVGSRVRLTDGIFNDYRGVIDRISDDHRVAILLNLLGREVRVFVPVASVGTI
jgi:transcriptional antiterminator RfaH